MEPSEFAHPADNGHSDLCELAAQARILWSRFARICWSGCCTTVLLLGLVLPPASRAGDVKWCDSWIDALKEGGNSDLTVVYEGNLYNRDLLVLLYGSDSERSRAKLMSNVVEEIGSTNIHGLLSLLKDGSSSEFPDHNVLAWISKGSVGFHVVFKRGSLSPESQNETRRRLSRYTDSRREGHSVLYTTDALQEMIADAPPSPSERPEEREARSLLVPRKWMKPSTNFLQYYVVDGPVAWVYTDLFKRQDAREFSPENRAKFDAVREEVMKKQKPGSLNARSYYQEVQQLIKERYGIDWLNPLDLNPGIIIN